MPEVTATINERVLKIAVRDARRIPGLVAIRVIRSNTEIYATRTRVSKRSFKATVRLPAQPSSARAGGVICVAAWYGDDLPTCDEKDEAQSIVRLRPAPPPRRVRMSQECEQERTQQA
jgi:hypothetical protein